MNLYIVRHGRTDWNDKGLLQGKANIPLNEYGIKETITSKEKIKDIKFDICIASPLERTKQTAEILIDKSCPIIYDDLLIERDLGDFEGKKFNYYELNDYWNYNLNCNSNNVEPVRNVLKRGKLFLTKLKKYKYDNVLIVSHGALIKSLHYNIIGYDENTDFESFHPSNSKIYKYEI